MDVVVDLTDGALDDLSSLYEWLLDEPELRGLVSAVEQPAAGGTMGPSLDSILVAISPDSVASVVTAALVSWVLNRRHISPRAEKPTGTEDQGTGLTVRITRPDGSELELVAEQIIALSAQDVRDQVDQMSKVLLAAEEKRPPKRRG
jgi:membrane-associated two-gene conflict system component 1 (EACC1)